ncbi:Trm112 family protein [Candidatus Harpocratesius sp.]
MKLWLLEILACPIDKSYPLEFSILSWNNPESTHLKIKNLLQNYSSGNVLFEDMKSPIHFEQSNSTGKWMIYDDLIIKPIPFDEYLQKLLEKIQELDVVHDLGFKEGEKLLNFIRSKIKSKLEDALRKIKQKEEIHLIIKTILPDLEFLNLYKYHLEIEDAVIVCPKCNRWFPVFDAIPQLLPDTLRKSEEDDLFKKKWNHIFKFPNKDH